MDEKILDWKVERQSKKEQADLFPGQVEEAPGLRSELGKRQNTLAVQEAHRRLP